jgi:hypothetical protein
LVLVQHFLFKEFLLGFFVSFFASRSNFFSVFQKNQFVIRAIFSLLFTGWLIIGRAFVFGFAGAQKEKENKDC